MFQISKRLLRNMNILLAVILLLATTKNSTASLLKFVKDYQVQLFENTIVTQIKIETEFLPIDQTFYDKVNVFLDNQSSGATTANKRNIDSSTVLLAKIKGIYNHIYVPYKEFEVKEKDMLSANVSYMTDAFQDPNLQPILILAESGNTTDQDLDIMSFNLFRLYALIQDMYNQYMSVFTGTISLETVQTIFKEKIDFPENSKVKLDLVSAGKHGTKSFAIYSMEFLTQPQLVQCYSILEIANYTLQYPNLCIYEEQGIIFSGNPPMSPLSMNIIYDKTELKKLKSDSIQDIMPLLTTNSDDSFVENVVGGVKFANNLNKVGYQFNDLEDYSPIIAAKNMTIALGKLLFNFRSQKEGNEIVTNSQTDEKLRNLIDNALSIFPQEFQIALLVLGICIIVLASVIITICKCRKRMKINRRKKREQAQLRTVNFLAFPKRREYNEKR